MVKLLSRKRKRRRSLYGQSYYNKKKTKKFKR